MKTTSITLAAAAVLGGALLGTARSSDNGTAVIRIGPTMAPVLTPRVRVGNDRAEPVNVWFVDSESKVRQRLGSVPAQATSTFAVPVAAAGVRIAVQPVGAREERYVSEDFDIDRTTDVHVRVADRLDQSSLEVTQLEIVGAARLSAN